jgi:hypothetical protein
LRSFAPAATQRLKAVPFSPFTWCLSAPLQASRGESVLLLRSFAWATTQVLKSLRFWPSVFFFVSVLQ